VERKLITTDCHIGPPFSLVDQLPESYRSYFTKLEARDDGRYLSMPITAGMSRLMGGDGESSTFAVKLDDDDPRAEAKAANPGCDEAEQSFDPAEMLADLERDGVYGAVLIGRISVFDSGTPAEVDAAYCQVVNDWLAETWGPYLDRVAPGIYLPYKDPVLCAKEIERAAAMGLRPALLPDGIHDQPYYGAEWEPVWEVCNALKIPITMHVGGLRNPPREHTLFPGFSYVGWYNQCVGMGETLGWLTFSGVFERYPDLHVVMTEGYAAWLGFAMQFFDHHWTDSRYSDMPMNTGPAAATLEAPPSYYLKRQAHATFMWDPLAVQARNYTGTDCLLWGNDYPHPEGSFPYSAQWNEKQFDGVPETDIDAICRDNAAKLFGITV
jgi:predicted TIM-barrel fold metal-dependent hydrolase